jgi:phage protein D
MSSTSVALDFSQDFYVPAFVIVLQERPLTAEVINDVIQVSYQDSIESVDSCSLTVNNWDAERRSFKYSDGNRFLPGQVVELWMGYHTGEGLRLMMQGELTSLQPTFPASGQPTLTVSAMNRLHHLRGKQSNAIYENLKASEIARQVVGRMQMGVELRTDPLAEAAETPYEYISQDNAFDLVFLLELAEEHAYELYVEERGQNGQAERSRLYFGRPEPRDIPAKLHYGSTLIDFQPSLITGDQVEHVDYNGWDSVNKRRIKVVSNFSDLASKPLNAGADTAAIRRAFANRTERIGHRPVNNLQEGRRLATKTHERIGRKLLTASGTTIGLPALRAGSTVRISGVGERFSGCYFITATTHSLNDGGYTTSFEGRRVGA